MKHHARDKSNWDALDLFQKRSPFHDMAIEEIAALNKRAIIRLSEYMLVITGVTELIMMKADVLSGLDTIKVCTHYNYDGQKIDFLPYDITSHPLSLVYKDFKGWKSDLQDLSQSIPSQLQDYIDFIEKEIKVPITMISVGPDRKQIIERKGVLA